MKKNYLYIQTIGCQMNVYDSEKIAQGLGALGFEQTFLLHRADVIILNTCSIREKAEQKAFSFLGRLADLKKNKPSLIIGVGGCVAQQEGERIFRRVPHVDLVFGTYAVARLPELVGRIVRDRCRVLDVVPERTIIEGPPLDAANGDGRPSRFVTVMRGCDNFCAYCVVPYVRGREVSRRPEDIVAEVENLVRSGVREVTLLGQNVNSYGKKEGLCSFAKLLEKVNGVPQLQRIRFTTSHPKDLSDELIDAFARLDKLCRHIHLPVQSGSNHILNRMNRRYTREDYLDKLARLRAACPGIAVTSDFIVGFPGETASDFQETLGLIRQVAFDGVFAFKYSDRPKVPAATFPDKVPETEKAARLQQLFDVQADITLGKNQALVGSLQMVLVEGDGRRPKGATEDVPDKAPQCTGRTSCNKVVNFSWPPEDLSGHKPRVGSMVAVCIEKALPHSLLGRPQKDASRAVHMKGARSYAA